MLLDTDLIAAYRMKRVVAEDRPRLDLYDETRFAARLAYDRLDPSAVCEVFQLNRVLMGTLLDSLSENDFNWVAPHPEFGRISLGRFVRSCVHHLEHHLRFMRQKRAILESSRASA